MEAESPWQLNLGTRSRGTEPNRVCHSASSLGFTTGAVVHEDATRQRGSLQGSGTPGGRSALVHGSRASLVCATPKTSLAPH